MRLTDLVSAEALEAVQGSGSFARRLPGVAFRSTEFLRLEYDNWLSRTWLFVGRGADMPNVGDARPAPGLPLFLVRDGDSSVRAYHNACRHRGHRLVSEPCSGLKKIVCPYHQWAYDLDGALSATPNVGGARLHTLEGLERANHSLVPVRCDTWHDWIFINLDGKAEPLEDFIAPLLEHVSFVDFAQLRHFLTMPRTAVEANWKLCLENTMEPYHVPVVHKSTAAGQPLDRHFMIDVAPVVGCGIDIEGSDYTNQPARGDADMSNLDMSARYLALLPNFFITTYAPDVVVDTMYVPDYRDPRRCWMEQAWYTTSGRVPSAEEVANWEQLEVAVMDEDISVMTGVQAGVESSAVDDGGVLTPAWESCIAGFYRHLVHKLEDGGPRLDRPLGAGTEPQE